MKELNKSSRHTGRYKSGVTLVEILVAIAILVLGVLPLMKMLRDGLYGVASSGFNSKASNIGQEVIEVIKQKKWAEECPTFTSTAPLAGLSAIGPNALENPAGTYTTLTIPTTSWDDIDDFHGSVFTRRIGDKGVQFDVKIAVNYATLPALANGGLGAITQVAGPTNYKIIIASITWTGTTGTPGGPVVLRTVRSNSTR